MSLLNFIGLAPAPSDDFWYTNPGRQTVAGVSVDENIAMTYATCWAASGLLATSGGMLPLKMMKVLPNGGAEPAREHPVYEVLQNPNEEMTGMMFRTSRLLQQINYGNCFAEIERTGLGRGSKLHPIHASRIPPKNIVREQGRLVYYVNNDDGSKTRMLAKNVFHVPSWMSDDGIVGRGVVENARLSIAMGIATETQGAAYFGNSARPSVVIEGGKFKNREEQEEYRRMWAETHGGPANSGRPAMLPQDAKLHALQFNAQDSQFLETRQHNVEEICRWYNVPPHMVQHLLRATYNNIEHMSMEFVKYSLMRWLELWEQEIDRKLLTKEERKQYFALHVVEGLERADIKTRTESLKDQFFNGEITLNEWRALENRNPIGPSGDVHFVQQAMIPLDMAVKGPQEPPKPEPAPAKSEGMSTEIAQALTELRADLSSFTESTASRLTCLEASVNTVCELQGEQIAELAGVKAEQATQGGLLKGLAGQQISMARAVLQDVFSRLLSVEVNAVKRVAEKPEKFTARLGEFYDKHAGTLRRSLAMPVKTYLAALGSDRDPEAAVGELATAHVAESLKQIDALLDCQAEELSARVDGCVNKWHEERLNFNLEEPKCN